MQLLESDRASPLRCARDGQPRCPSMIKRYLSIFHRDTRGNVAVIFTIALIPIIAAVGCAVDYSVASRVQAKLQAAADAASVGAISVGSAGYNAAMSMTSNGSVPAGVTQASNFFDGNASTATGYNGLVVSSTVTKTGTALSSNVQFTAQVPTTFMSVVGFNSITVGGTSSSTASLPLYLDFYLMLDVSGSMGLPSTTAEAQRMQSISWVPLLQDSPVPQFQNQCQL